jgi:hypothetical protein
VAGPLNGTIFAVVDVETTGLKPESGDRGRFSTLVNPERPIPPGFLDGLDAKGRFSVGRGRQA